MRNGRIGGDGVGDEMWLINEVQQNNMICIASLKGFSAIPAAIQGLAAYIRAALKE